MRPILSKFSSHAICQRRKAQLRIIYREALEKAKVVGQASGARIHLTRANRAVNVWLHKVQSIGYIIKSLSQLLSFPQATQAPLSNPPEHGGSPDHRLPRHRCLAPWFGTVSKLTSWLTGLLISLHSQKLTER